MGVYISLKDYDNAIEFLQKTSSYNDIYNNINTVLNNLDYNILKDIREQLISSRDNINNAKFSVDDIKQKISKNKSTYEEIESRFGKSVIAAAAAGGVVASNQIKPNLNYNSNNIPTITKIEETGGFLSEAWNTVSNFASDAISGVKEIVGDISDALNNTGAKVCEFFDSTKSKVATFFSGVGNDISNFISDAKEKLKCTAASIANVFIGFSEGVAWLGEMVADTCSIIGTAAESIFTGVYDFGQWINGMITGEDWESATVKKWERRIEKVKVSKVANAYDNFYQNNKIGQWLDANACDLCKSTGAIYELSKNIGYITGVVGLSILTFGVAGGVLGGAGVTTTVSAGQMAATAAFAGFGKGAESAWQQGASITEGLAYGGLSGAWEGLQFYIGGKIGAQGGYGDQIANKLLSNGATAGQKMLFSSGTRIVLDSIDSALEGFVQPILQTLYADGYYNENGEFILFTKDDGPFKRISALFDDNGGWENVGMQALIGGIGSTIGEIGNLRRFLRPTEKFDVNTNSAEVGLTTGSVNGIDHLEATNKIDLDVTQPLPILTELETTSKSLPSSQLTENMISKINKMLGINLQDIEYTYLQKQLDISITDPRYFKKTELLEKQKNLLLELGEKLKTVDVESPSAKNIDLLTDSQRIQVEKTAQQIFDTAAKEEPSVSAMMKSLEGSDARLAGFENRTKTLEGIQDKIARNLQKGYSLTDVNDSLRYTLLLDEETYTNTVIKKMAELKKAGYEIKYMNNSWGNKGFPTYQGLNVTLVSPEGNMIELQFHTQASFDVKQKMNHNFYEISRNNSMPKDIVLISDEIQVINQQLYVRDVGFDVVDSNTLNSKIDEYILNGTLPLPTTKNYMVENGYIEFLRDNQNNFASWNEALKNNPELKTAINEYKGEGLYDPASYKIVNAYERGSLFDDVNNEVTIIGTGGYPKKYSYAEYEKEIGCSIEEFKMKIEQSSQTLSEGLGNCHLSADTQLIRGVNMDTLKYKFDIEPNDSVDTIIAKIEAKGNVWNEPGFSSTCPRVLDEDLPSIVTSKKVQLIMDVEADIDARLYGDETFGDYELEILLDKNQTFDITKVEQNPDNGKIYIYMKHRPKK